MGLAPWPGTRFASETFVGTPAAGPIGGFFVRGAGKQLVGVRARIATGACRLKVRRTTAAGAVSEPAKEVQVTPAVGETALSVALADRDLLELVCESAEAPGLLYCTYFLRTP